MSLQSSSDTSIGAAFPAFRVNLSSGETHKLSIKYKGSSATSNGFYVRVYEYNSALPAGKLAVSNSATNPLVQEDTSGKTNWKENQPVTTSWQTTDYTYTPTAGAVWASIVILNWTGIGTNHLYIRDPEHQLISDGTLDGLDSTQFLRSDASDTMTGTLNISTGGFADQLTVNRSDGDYFSYIKYTNSVSGELGRMGFTQGNVLSYRVGSGGTNQNIFHDSYHPNADKWTTARTLSLSGDASGSVSWDGSANATLSVSNVDAETLDGYDHTDFGATLATYGTTANSSGRIRITAPFNTNSSHMFQITISVYSSYTVHTYVVGGYMYSTTNQWYNSHCIYSGSGSPNIVVGRDSNGKAYISIANGNYTGVRVHNMTRGYQTSLSDTYDPWTITINGATENSTTPTIYKTWNSGNDGSGSGLDADLLDGNHASAFATAAQGTLADNALPKAGGTMTGDLVIPNKIIHSGDSDTYFQFHGNNTARMVLAGAEVQEWGANYTLFSDNDTVRLGSGSDFRMHFNGTDTIFRNYAHANGDVFFQGEGSDGVNETAMKLDFSGTRSYAILYENSAERFRTNSAGIGVTGNISVTGTVDGVDIAARDGVLTTTTTTANAALPKAGGTMTGNVTFNDSTELLFGTGGDFKIAFNGTDTFLSNTANTGGDVFLGGNVSNGVYQYAAKLDYSGTSAYVILYNGNQEVLRTRSGGIDVSSHIYIDGNIYHNGDTNTYMGFHAADQWRVVTGGTERLEVSNNTMLVAATLSMNAHQIDMNNNDIVGVDQIVHEGDSDTYMQFHAPDQWRVVTGGAERLEVNNSQITSTEPIHAPSFHGDGSALTGIEAGMNSWTSSTFAWAKDTTYSFTHDLGVAPKAFSVEYVCVSPIYGYAVGDTLFNMGERYSNWGQIVLKPTSTTVKLAMLDSGILIRRQDSQSTTSQTLSTYFHVRLNLFI